MTETIVLNKNYLYFVTGFCGFLKVFLCTVSLTVPIFLFSANPQEQIMWIPMGSILGGVFGIFGALGYSSFFISTLEVHRRITWHRVVYIDLIVTLTLLVSVFIMPTEFYIAGAFWSLLSVVADIMAEMIILDPTLLKFNRIVGIITFIVGFILKFSGLSVQPEVSTVLSVLGGVLSVVGFGEQAK